MVLHALLLLASAVQGVANTPPPVQVTLQQVHDPWWKSLLPTIVQTVVSLASIAAGVGIAVWSFRRNRQTEHEQWTRNQSQAEWKELIQKVAKLEHEIPVIVTGLPDHQGLETAIMAVLPELRGTLFVFPTLESNGYIKKWQDFLSYASGQFLSMTGTNRAVQRGTLGEPVSLEDRQHWDEIASHEEWKIRTQFHELVAELRTLAHTDLRT